MKLSANQLRKKRLESTPFWDFLEDAQPSLQQPASYHELTVTTDLSY